MYKQELSALKRSNRLRERTLYGNHLLDFASNDYLGFADNQKAIKKAFDLLKTYDSYAPKASMLVNGYHPLHCYFENNLCNLNGFERGVVLGSGFLANIALIEGLVRKKDVLFIDREYHASGILASKLIDTAQVVTFVHNDPDDLARKLRKYPHAKRKIIAIEGVYSMSGDIASKEIIELANAYEALLIVDEAHSSGVIGEHLSGLFDYYRLPIRSNYIKLGTLGKAYGSYGAYILASSEIISFLENRAKPIIYSTALSLFDVALGVVNLKSIYNKQAKLAKKIKKRQKTVQKVLGIEMQALILSIPQHSNSDAIANRQLLIEEGYLVGAIRQPTVKSPILRIIPRLGRDLQELNDMLDIIRDLK